VSVVLAFIVGFAMLGAMTFLPTYLQYVQGVSATASGLRTLPLVVGLLVTSIFSGSAVGRTGRYKIFPIAGSLIMAIGLYLLSRMDAHTSFWIMSVDMLVLGIGIGLCMQVLTIIVQSTVDYRDLGVATSGVTFFRTLGSSFGAAVFGTFFANALNSRLPAAIAAAGIDPRVAAIPSELHRLPAQTIAPIVDAYAQSIQVVFFAAVPVALVAFVLALFLKEVPLRQTSRAGASDVGEAFSMPEGTDSAQALQIAISRLLRKHGREALDYVGKHAGTSLTVADGWCVWQVYVRAAMGDDPALTTIGRRVRVPSSVLAPAFSAARDHGYLAGPDDALRVTESGRIEIDKVTTAIRKWLGIELADWGEADDEQLQIALEGLARQFVEDDPEPVASSAPALTG
jgi:MFS family permease